MGVRAAGSSLLYYVKPETEAITIEEREIARFSPGVLNLAIPEAA